MTDYQHPLYTKIKAFELDDEQAALTFTDRLARENNWSLSYGLRAVLEYKRFMFLICLAEHPLTPSDQVDQVWHLHLLYTESYWNDFCSNTLGRPVHHGPTKGGLKEGEKFQDWYEKTKQLYEKVFQQAPPPDIWPSGEIRFRKTNFKRINLNEHWLIRKPKF